MLLSVVQMGGNLLFPADIVHEITGTVLFVLWAVHVVLNRRWYGSLFRGKYTAYRTVQAVINVCILLCALFLMISGIILSAHVYTFLHIGVGASFARTAHLLASHWYFMCMSLHIGMHAGMSVLMMHAENHSAVRQLVLRIITAAACVYGVYAFIIRGLWKYLFYLQPFFYLDIERGYVLFFIDYACIMVLAASAAAFLCRHRA